MSEKARELTGATDGRHHEFKCSDCEAPLADLWVMHPERKQALNFIAECCHCGGRSYSQSVEGGFVMGQTEKGAKYTNIVDVDYGVDPILIKTEQVKEYRG